jgi:hypothetical protein
MQWSDDGTHNVLKHETCNQLYEKEKGIDRLTHYCSNQEHDSMQHLQAVYIL